MPGRLVGVNERGDRINEDHPAAKLSMALVDEMRDLYDAGIGYKRLAQRFGVSVSCVRAIVTFRTWVQWPVRFKRVVEKEGSDG